jgi:2-amino-4-hydroxy-6-hydroxymethyldihydropteridine diphosphokinase
MASDVFIGLGSNLGERQQQLRWAVKHLDGIDGVKVTLCSSLYETAPLGNFSDDDIGDQPDFLNAVCQVDTALSAEQLLTVMLDLETQAGRSRNGGRNSPRTLDLDLLLYGDQVIQSGQLTLPHPRLHNRAFVLYPLLEIAPLLTIPGKGRADKFINNVESQAIKKTGHRLLPK